MLGEHWAGEWMDRDGGGVVREVHLSRDLNDEKTYVMGKL